MAEKSNKITNINEYRPGKIHMNPGMIVFIVILVYMIICMIMYFNTKHIVGYEVVEGSLSVPNVYEGIALRDETVYSASGTGYINFFAREAEHVACGDLIYTLDSSGKIAEMMESSEEEILFSDRDLGDIQNNIIHFQNSFTAKDFEKVYDFKGQVDGMALKLSNYNMLSNINSILGSSADNVSFQYAPTSGVVVYGIDGYEDLKAENVTNEMFGQEQKIQEQLEANQLVGAEDKAYKLLKSEDWSIVIPMEKTRAQELLEEEYVEVKFLKNQYTSWARVNVLENADGTYLKLDFTNSMITFATDRYIDLEILYHQEKGLKVPNSAIAEQEFFLIPIAYRQDAMSGGTTGKFLRESYNEEGELVTKNVEAKIYFADDEYYYVDTSNFKIGDHICKTDSAEKMQISKVGTLIGVYNINKGYADFTSITILYSNEEYSIVKSNTKYGLSEYDYIVLDASTVNADDFIYE
ncbi:MAG: hypothetical protein E7289_02230 [Lachnospiraceae bacterium]|nr:hypothetical protein [Lachnospiraceae bacterium]